MIPHPCRGWGLRFEPCPPSRKHSGLCALRMILAASKEAGTLSCLKPTISPFGSLSKPGFLFGPPVPPTFHLYEHLGTGVASGKSLFLFCVISFASRNGGRKIIFPNTALCRVLVPLCDAFHEPGTVRGALERT